MQNYPFLYQFSKDIGVAPEKLIAAFEYEEAFHKKILKESDFEKRQLLYADIYNVVHELYGTTKRTPDPNKKYKIVKLFKKELSGKSILDIGCGEGNFLLCIEKKLKHKRLVGLDVSVDVLPKLSNIEFIKTNIVDFDLADRFDVITSDNVMEHIAPKDLDIHLHSVTRHLKSNGALIIMMPNRLFGPNDVTRIIDYTNSNKVPAMGTHLSEMSYTEIIKLLKRHGFKKFKAIIPIPIIKYMMPNIRIPAKFMLALEHKLMLNILYKIKYKSRCVLTQPIMLVCKF